MHKAGLFTGFEQVCDCGTPSGTVYFSCHSPNVNYTINVACVLFNMLGRQDRR